MTAAQSIRHGISGLRFLGQAPSWLALAIVVTIPLLFGAVHPIVQGAYVALILLGLGGWLLYTLPSLSGEGLSWRRLAVPIILMLYAALQALPLPLGLIALLSPARAERVAMVNDLAGAGLTLAPLGDNGIIGLQTAIFILALILLYLALTVLLRRDQRFPALLLTAIAAVGLAEAFYGLLQVMNPGIGMLWLGIANPEAHGTIIYKNQYAALLNICWPLAVAGALLHLAPTGRAAAGPRGRPSLAQRLARSLTRLQPQVPILLFAAGVMILAVLFSLSRGGILAMLTVSVLLNLLLPLSRRTRLVAIVGIVAFIGVYGSMLGLDGIVARFGTIEDYTGEFRLQIYQASLPLLFDHWLTGIGVDAYKLLSGVYLKGFPDNVLIDRAHNEYLETAIEFGLPLAALFVGWLIAGMWRSGRRLTAAPAADRPAARKARIVGIAAFSALFGFLVHGLVDFGWRLPANAVYAVTLLALISWAVAELGQNGQRREDTTAAVKG
ncbi:O-antigen ligase family protein [Desulfoprunum benzoelyticum]|uniref:O-antigen ligase n=1 Tax=Desulfoprunum benzoelyticum TaxID=1506996 RepID=A0A840V2X7_9BACT|nr:O-antigen ligase family protein [Desulfoprunum benzoelyticum]MBB5348089.1 O-antigen ligase [Desulfoprunum benzoelyticum]MBM9531799.1 O-antigen ligase family protein [Desulfoprunum benzoelyticum]